MTNILVPTDFSTASLKYAEQAIEACSATPCNLILFHAFALPQTPFELLGNRNTLPGTLLTDSFRQSCRQLKSEYRRKLAKIIVRPLHGNSRALFQNFLDANEIDLIFYPENFSFTPCHPSSLDPKYFFQKAGIPVLRAPAAKPKTVVIETRIAKPAISIEQPSL